MVSITAPGLRGWSACPPGTAIGRRAPPCSDDHHIVRELGEPPPPDPGPNTLSPVAGAGPDTRE